MRIINKLYNFFFFSYNKIKMEVENKITFFFFLMYLLTEDENEYYIIN